jgi:hypothetical protein
MMVTGCAARGSVRVRGVGMVLMSSPVERVCEYASL